MRSQITQFETDVRHAFDARLFRAPFSPSLFLLALAGCALFRGGVALIGRLAGEPYLWQQFVSSFVRNVFPISPSIVRAKPYLGAELSAPLFALILGLAVVLWAIFAIAACRIVAVRLARHERIGAREALAFSWNTRRSSLAYAATAAFVLVLFYVGNGALGLVGLVPTAGPFLILLVLPIAVILSLVFSVFVLGYVGGIGLATACLATERNGSFDAVSRVFDYLFRQPAYVLFAHVLIVVFAKVLFWAGDAIFLEVLPASLTLFAEPESTRGVLDVAIGRPGFDASSLDPAHRLVAGVLWMAFALMRLGVAAVVVSFVLSASTFLYFTLREALDRTTFDDLDRGLRTADMAMTGMPREDVTESGAPDRAPDVKHAPDQTRDSGSEN